MKWFQHTLLLFIGTLLFFSSAMAAGSKKYIVMQQDLGEIKKDFNESIDKIKLVFIISPT